MINSQDRAFYFGASDTSMIVGNWNTKTFRKWWLEKLGLRNNTINTKAMKTGTAYEQRILDALPDQRMRRNHQIIIPDLRLRVNYDADHDRMPIEIKTHKNAFKVTPAYFGQVQVEIFALGGELGLLIAYHLTEEDYGNYFAEIDKSRLSFHSITYDENWMESKYFPRIKHLCKCLEAGEMPQVSDLATGGVK
jgi:hypothetical protein